MSRELQQFAKSQFAELILDLEKGWGVPAKVVGAIEPQLRGLHKRYLGFANLASVVGDGAIRADYIRAIPEVSYLSLVLILKGLENPSFVLMRQSIELVLKHIYFSTHPVEYSWSATRLGYREISFQFLLEYLRKTDELQKLSGGVELVQRIETEFHILSRYVHVHSESFIQFSRFEGHSKAHVRPLHAFEERSRELWPRLIVLLVAFFPHRFAGASIIEQKLIRFGLPPDLKTDLSVFLKAVATR